MGTPPETGGALKGFSENVKQFSKFKPSRAPLQPPCVPALPLVLDLALSTGRSRHLLEPLIVPAEAVDG